MEPLAIAPPTTSGMQPLVNRTTGMLAVSSVSANKLRRVLRTTPKSPAVEQAVELRFKVKGSG